MDLEITQRKPNIMYYPRSRDHGGKEIERE